MRRTKRRDGIDLGNLSKISDNSKSPLHHDLLKYAVNLLDWLDMTEGFMDFIFSLLSSDSHRKLIEYICPPKTSQKERNRILGEMQYSSRQRSRQLQHLITQNSDIHIRKLEGFIHTLCIHDYRNIQKQPIKTTNTPINAIKELFGFSEEETALIRFIYYYNKSEDFESLVQEYKKTTLHHVIAAATGIHVQKVKNSLGSNSKLVLSGIIDECRRPWDDLSLDANIFEFLLGVGDSSLIEKYCRKNRVSPLHLKSFNMSPQSIRIISSLLQSDKACNIMLYGRAGTGKTEFIRSIISHCGKNCYFLRYGDDGDNSDRKTALNVAIHSIAQKEDAVLVIDEADTFLNLHVNRGFRSNSLDKGWVNDLFDNLGVKLVWITNKVDHIEESTLRRFSYSLQFKKQTFKERQQIWNSLLKKSGLEQKLDKETIKDISIKYAVNAAGIASAINTVTRIIDNNNINQEEIHEILSDVLSRHETLISGDVGKSTISALTSRYDHSALNLDTDKKAIINSLKSFRENRHHTKPQEGDNANLLFWGLPGTGKTEFAKYLASRLNLPLLVKRASDLESMWVGETEKNIRKAFEEANREDAILFVDEADSFFTDRSSANRSWEISRTNEFLTQMENHKGILICCTNLLATLDRASIRRFNRKIEFKPLTPEGTIKLFYKYFKQTGTRLNATLRQQLITIPALTPGDFKSVHHNNKFAPPKTLTYKHIIAQLAKEVSYRNNDISSIGFQKC